MTQREIEVRGFKVEVVDFGYASFYYPSFNGNAEFRVNSKGFKQLNRYLGMIKWIQSQMPEFWAVRPFVEGGATNE